MKYFSMFSGIGGFELGIKRGVNLRPAKQSKSKRSGKYNGTADKFEKWQCMGFSEIDKYAIQIYQKHFPSHKNYGDATKLIPEELPDFDFLTAGFPCQSFSIAGKRRGFDDTRGTLFFDICRVLRVKRPSYFLLENVQGLLNHDKGKTFEIILESLEELGYGCQRQTLNSKYFGVPQNRKRVFIIGYLREVPRPEIFPIREGTCEISKKRTGECISGTLSTSNQSGEAQWDGSTTLIQVGNLGKDSLGERVYDVGGVGVQLNSQGGGWGTKTGLYMVQRERGFNKGGKRELPNLTDQNYHQNNALCGIRRLTPLECERLQGFPDGWTEGVSDTQRYKCLGNAVTVNVIEEIIRRLASA